ncbi:MAG TPA: acetyltransferase [Blastocatellia bacterium]|nr:acetyltransferase [Blastocatellia bacterium]
MLKTFPQRVLWLGLLSMCVGLFVIHRFDFSSQAAGSHYTDPTAQVSSKAKIGDEVFIGPFATLLTDAGHIISVGGESNIQDNVTLEATKGDIHLGEMVILAHGAIIKGDAELGEHGHCPKGEAHCASFVGFNSEVDGAIIEMNAMVTHLARVAPGVTLRSGWKVLPGKNVTTQAEADDPSLGKVAEVTQADLDFMHGVIEVNVAFADTYSHLKAGETSGINIDPDTAFNHGQQLPTLNGTPTQDANFRNRIIGAVLLSNTLGQLDDVMGSRDSLRADEGSPFVLGPIAFMGSGVTFHALEHTAVQISGNARFESGSLVHGGPNSYSSNTTVAGFGFRLGAKSVFFNSRIGALGRVGFKTAVLGSDLGTAPNTRIGDCQIINNGQKAGVVEWCY